MNDIYSDIYTIKPIGIVENKIETISLKVEEKDIALDKAVSARTDRYSLKSKILIKDEFKDCLDGIEGFSHIVILFWTHKTTENSRLIKKVHPGGIEKCPKKGIFATRSPARPNPICITTVKLLKRIDNTLIVEGFDAINKTPIIDIKPYLPNYDFVKNAKLPTWMIELSNFFRKKK